MFSKIVKAFFLKKKERTFMGFLPYFHTIDILSRKSEPNFCCDQPRKSIEIPTFPPGCSMLGFFHHGMRIIVSPRWRTPCTRK